MRHLIDSLLERGCKLVSLNHHPEWLYEQAGGCIVGSHEGGGYDKALFGALRMYTRARAD